MSIMRKQSYNRPSMMFMDIEINNYMLDQSKNGINDDENVNVGGGSDGDDADDAAVKNQNPWDDPLDKSTNLW